MCGSSIARRRVCISLDMCTCGQSCWQPGGRTHLLACERVDHLGSQVIHRLHLRGLEGELAHLLGAACRREQSQNRAAERAVVSAFTTEKAADRRRAADSRCRRTPTANGETAQVRCQQWEGDISGRPRVWRTHRWPCPPQRPRRRLQRRPESRPPAGSAHQEYASNTSARQKVSRTGLAGEVAATPALCSAAITRP